MSFLDTIYPVRHNRNQLVARLLEAEPRSFTQIVSFPEMPPRTPGHIPYSEHMVGGLRAVVRGGAVRYNQTPRALDRRIVRTILRAWCRQTSDRYLAYINVLRAAQHVTSPNTPEYERSLYAITTRDEAAATVRANAPEGCVKFVYNELSASTLPVFGDRIRSNMSFNEYYTALLVWDDFNLTGLIAHISRERERNSLMEGGRLNLVLQAASDWIARSQETAGTMYHALRTAAQ